MGSITKCFHCLEGDLTLGIENKKENEVYLYCGRCGSNFRFEKEDEPLNEKTLPQVLPTHDKVERKRGRPKNI